MKLHILGSGTILSPHHRNPSGYLLRKNSRYLLIDAGPGILRRLDELQINTLDLDGILLSHFHLDHCNDVFSILMKRHLLKQGANIDFFVAGSGHLSGWFEQMALLQGGWLNNYRPELIDLTLGTFQWKGQKITCHPTFHTKNSIAIRLEGEKSIFYSGDADYTEDLVAFARLADIAVVECSHQDIKKVAGHMTPSETGRFAELAQVKQLIATHIYPENDDPNLKDQINKHFNGKISIAYDGMVISI